MSYKDLNVYQLAYRVAIDLHRWVEANIGELSTTEIHRFKDLSRECLANIAESFNQSPGRSKRFYNFKAMDKIGTLLVDLDFLHDTKKMETKDYEPLYEAYSKCHKMLYKMNTESIDGTEPKIIHPTLN